MLYVYEKYIMLAVVRKAIPSDSKIPRNVTKHAALSPILIVFTNCEKGKLLTNSKKLTSRFVRKNGGVVLYVAYR